MIYINNSFQQPAPILNQRRLVPLAKNMPHSFVLLVEPNPVAAIQPPHAFADIPRRSPKQEMIMVRHQAIGKHPKPIALTRFLEKPQEMRNILIMTEQLTPVIPTCANVINTPCHTNS